MAGEALFPILVKDAAFQPANAAAYYVVAANGLFLVRDTPLFSASVPVDTGVPGLQEQEAGLTLRLPRLPRVLLDAALGFFRDVFERWRGEAILIMFYDPVLGRFAFRAPPQRITGRVEAGRFRADLRLDYRACDRPGPGYVKLGTFHSHGNTAPWHSGVDIHDELYEAGLHITAGYVDSQRPEFAAAFVVGRTRFTVAVADILPASCAARRPPRSWIGQVTVVRQRWGGRRRGAAREVGGRARMQMTIGRRIKLIGCGGVGGHVAPHLCRYLHAERHAAHVVLIDGDAFEERNRSRMRFGAYENKALVMARELAAAFGDVLTIEPVSEYVTAANLHTLVEDGDLIFLAVDNHATRKLVGAACAALRDVTLISGGNDGVEDGRDGTYGNVQFVRRVAGGDATHALERFHPEIREPRDGLPSDLGCAELAQSAAPQLLFTNLAVASAMLNVFYGWLRGSVPYEEVYLDIVKNRVVPVERRIL